MNLKRIIVQLIICVTILTACLQIPVSAAAISNFEITLSKKEKTITKILRAGTKLRLKVKAGNTVLTPGKVKFSSSAKSIATVNKNGVVKAKKAGNVSIRVKYKKQSAKIVLKIKRRKKSSAGKIPVKSIKLNKSKLTLQANTKNETFQLKAIITPSNASDKKISWKSSNPDIASVDGGDIYMVCEEGGTATITAKTSNGLKAKCRVTVKPAAFLYSVERNFFLSSTTEWLNTNTRKSITLKAMGIPEKEASKVRWYTTVTENGKEVEVEESTRLRIKSKGTSAVVTGLKPCRTDVYCQYGNRKVKCKIYVEGYYNNNEVFEIVYGKTKFSLNENEQKKFGKKLVETYPEIYGLFKKQYADKCKTDLQKLVCISRFYRDKKAKYTGSNDYMESFIRNFHGACSNFAFMAFDLCCVMGIPVANIVCSNHEWNQVKINNKWYPVDFTGGTISFYPKTPGNARSIRDPYGTSPAKTVSLTPLSYEYDGKKISLKWALYSYEDNIFVFYDNGEIKSTIPEQILPSSCIKN